MHARSKNENERSNALMEYPFEEDMLYSLEMTDESSMIDGEVGKRLNQMVPVPVSANFGLTQVSSVCICAGIHPFCFSDV